jgi:hypothetical protein
MWIVDTALKARADQNRPIRVGIVGAGFMCQGLTNQIVNSTPGMRVVAMSNRRPSRRGCSPAPDTPVRMPERSRAAAVRQPAIADDGGAVGIAHGASCSTRAHGATDALTDNSYRCSQPHNTIHNILQPLTSAPNLFIR